MTADKNAVTIGNAIVNINALNFDNTVVINNVAVVNNNAAAVGDRTVNSNALAEMMQWQLIIQQ